MSASKKQKSSKDEVSSPKGSNKHDQKPFYFGIVEDQVKRIKLYHGFDDEVERIPGAPNDPLFTFSKKEYYPVGLFDRSTKKMVIQASTKLKMSVNFEMAASQGRSSISLEHSKFEVTLSQTKGIYWFGLIIPHYCGILHIQASVESNNDIEPLLATVKVVGEPNSEIEISSEEADTEDVESELVEEVEAEVAKPSKFRSSGEAVAAPAEPSPSVNAKDKKKSRSSTSAVVEKEDQVVASSSTSSKKKKRSRSLSTTSVTIEDKNEDDLAREKAKPTKKARSSISSPSVKVTAAPESIDMEEDEENQAKPSRQNKKRRVAVPIISEEKYRTLPFPPLNYLPAHARINRPHADPITIKGPQISLSIPPSLSLALKDDRLRIDALQMQYPEVMRSSSEQQHQNMLQLQYITNNEAFPTVNELLHRLENKVSHIAEASAIIQSLRNAFEYYFTNRILYKLEYLVMEDKILDLEARKLKYGDSFGAPFLLRYIVFIVAFVDSFELQGSTESGDSSGSSSNSASRSSSAQRRSAVQGRQTKALHYRLQEVLEVLVADMDDYAHLLFY